MTENLPAGDPNWVDPDDAAELDDAFFEHADVYQGATLVRRGRPRSNNPKTLVTLRLDADLLAQLEGTGPGWRTRVNGALRDWIGKASTSS